MYFRSQSKKKCIFQSIFFCPIFSQTPVNPTDRQCSPSCWGLRGWGEETASFGISPEIQRAVAYGAEREQSLLERQQCAAVRHLKRVSTYVSTVEYHYKWVIPVKHGECPKPSHSPHRGLELERHLGACLFIRLLGFWPQLSQAVQVSSFTYVKEAAVEHGMHAYKFYYVCTIKWSNKSLICLRKSRFCLVNAFGLFRILLFHWAL